MFAQNLEKKPKYVGNRSLSTIIEIHGKSRKQAYSFLVSVILIFKLLLSFVGAVSDWGQFHQCGNIQKGIGYAVEMKIISGLTEQSREVNSLESSFEKPAPAWV